MRATSLIDLAVGVARALPSGLYDGRGIERYLESVLSDPDRVNDFRMLDNELLPDHHGPRHLRADRAGRPGLGRRPDLEGRGGLYRAADGLQTGRDQGPPPGGRGSNTTNVDIAVEAGARFVIVVNPLVPYVNDFQKMIPDDAREPRAPGARHGLPADRLPGVQAARPPAPARGREAVEGEVPGRGHRPDRARPERRADVRDEHPQLHPAGGDRPPRLRVGDAEARIRVRRAEGSLRPPRIEISANRVRRWWARSRRAARRPPPSGASSSRRLRGCCVSPRRPERARARAAGAEAASARRGSSPGYGGPLRAARPAPLSPLGPAALAS